MIGSTLVSSGRDVQGEFIGMETKDLQIIINVEDVDCMCLHVAEGGLATLPPPSAEVCMMVLVLFYPHPLLTELDHKAFVQMPLPVRGRLPMFLGVRPPYPTSGMVRIRCGRNLHNCCYSEGVAIEIAEAVVGALKGELAATAMNAPMVPSEILQGAGTACRSARL